MFDLRSLEHSTIIYETPDLTPLMRLSWNKQDPNYLATILTDSPKTVIVDIRSVIVYYTVCHHSRDYLGHALVLASHQVCHSIEYL